jgi:hypothetical protein
MNRWLIAGALVLLVSFGAMACGGGDKPLTLKEFFTKWEAVNDDARSKLLALSTKYPRAFKDDVQQTKDYYPQYVAIFDDTDSRLKDIAPPEEVRSVVEEQLATEAKMSVVHHDRLGQLGGVTTGDQLNEVFKPNQDYQDLRARDAELCGQLVQIASDNDIVYIQACGQ